MQLSPANYHSRDANLAFWSNSSFKSWLDCPARTAAELRGDWVEDEKTHFLVGSYVDIALLTPDELPFFVECHSDAIRTKKGDLRADFVQAEKMIARAKRDPLFMGALDGEHQRVITFEMFGQPWRVMMDAVDFQRGTLTDLKTTRGFEATWSDTARMKLPFYEAFGYWQQMAIYREAYKSVAGEYPEVCSIAAVTKSDHPRLKVLVFDSPARFAHELERIEESMPAVVEAKAHFNDPQHRHCGVCDYCSETLECGIEAAESLKW